MSLFGVRLVCFIVRNSFFTGSFGAPTRHALRFTPHKNCCWKIESTQIFPSPLKYCCQTRRVFTYFNCTACALKERRAKLNRPTIFLYDVQCTCLPCAVCNQCFHIFKTKQCIAMQWPRGWKAHVCTSPAERVTHGSNVSHITGSKYEPASN